MLDENYPWTFDLTGFPLVNRCNLSSIIDFTPAKFSFDFRIHFVQFVSGDSQYVIEIFRYQI